MTIDNNWFSEIDLPNGCAFSLHIKAKLHEEQTPFQKIAIYETLQFGRLMTIDGCVMLTDRDNFIYHEMIAHPVLFTHPEPRKVVIIGGGDCGTLREVLKHATVEQVIQVDIDERVTRLAEQYFPALCTANQDPRAQLLFADGVGWMTQAADNSVDIIIIDSTDPIGPGTGLFNQAFYQQCRRVLTPQGLLVQQSESPLLHLPLLRAIHQAMRAAGFQTTHSLHFPQCVYPSGWWTVTLAGHQDLTQFRFTAARQKTFETRYYNAELHQGSLNLPTFLNQALSQ